MLNILALLVSFILCQYFEPFTCCDDFSHLLAWEKLSFVLYFSLVLESSSLSSDDFRQFLAWRAGPRLHVGSGALMAFLTSSHRLYPQPFSDRASDGRPTKRRWINLPIEVEICYKVRKKNKFCGAPFKSKRDCIYCNGKIQGNSWLGWEAFSLGLRHLPMFNVWSLDVKPQLCSLSVVSAITSGPRYNRFSAQTDGFALYQCAHHEPWQRWTPKLISKSQPYNRTILNSFCWIVLSKLEPYTSY